MPFWGNTPALPVVSRTWPPLILHISGMSVEQTWINKIPIQRSLNMFSALIRNNLYFNSVLSPGCVSKSLTKFCEDWRVLVSHGVSYVGPWVVSLEINFYLYFIHLWFSWGKNSHVSTKFKAKGPVFFSTLGN